MKTWIMVGLVWVMALPVRAQLFSSEALGGAALGGLVGGIIGNNNHGKTGEGVAIGAGAGLLLGAIVHNERDRREYYTYTAPPPAVGSPVYVQSWRPNYAVSGAVVGGIAGGVIGNNSGHKTAEGIAIGAGAGLLLGTVAEQNARRHERALLDAPLTGAPVETLPQTNPVQSESVSPPVPTRNSIDYSGSTSRMSQANSLFGR